jgi:hypothetical protein
MCWSAEAAAGENNAALIEPIASRNYRWFSAGRPEDPELHSLFPNRQRGGLMMRAPFIILLASLALVVGCAEKRPVLYPNATLERQGQPAAQSDIDACIRMAKDHQAGGDQGGELAKKTGQGAVVGGAVGGAVGAVTGNLGRGLAAGAAGGAAGGLTRGLFESSEPDPITRSFVERCLREKDYEPIGWK